MSEVLLYGWLFFSAIGFACGYCAGWTHNDIVRDRSKK